MAKAIHLDIVSAEKSLFSGDALLVVATGELGEIGVTHGHAQLLTKLKPGEIRVTLTDKREEVFYVSGGLMEVQPHVVTVLADEAERADHLDEALAEAAQQRAREALQSRGEGFDHSHVTAELAKAVAQIQAIRRVRKHVK